MKKTALVIMIFCCSYLAGMKNCDAKLRIIIGYGFSTVNNGCEEGHGLCVIISWRIVDENFDVKDLADDMGLAEIEIVDNQLVMNLLYDRSKGSLDRNFDVVKNIMLDQNVCEQLGYRSILIEAGKYELDFKNFKYGSVMLPVQLRN